MSEEYRQAINSLARETKMSAASAARVEQKILDAFASRDVVGVEPLPGMKRVARRPRSDGRPITASWRPLVPVAAALVLAAGAALVVWMNRQPPAVRQNIATAAEKVAPAPIVETTIDRPSSNEVSVAHSPRPKRKPPQKPNVVTPSGFVDLPWTAGLPAFESGEIVRMDLAVASLPTYGIDISPGAGKGPVEADVLIGQDGFARAIRLVTTAARSTQ